MSRIFISYSHQDEAWKNRVAAQLGVLAQQGMLEVWDDQRIAAGDDWLPAIETALGQCDVALLLVSAAFLNSNFILRQEIPPLLQRRAAEGVRVIPVIIRPCAWRKIPWLAAIQGRPKDGTPLSSMSENGAEQALADLAEEVWGLCSSPCDQPRPARESALTPTPLPESEGLNGAALPCLAPTRLRHGAAHLFGRDAELQALDQAWRNPQTRVLTVVAWGGTGKTSLVLEWLNRFSVQNWPGCRRVFDWSFYSQGSRDDGAASADSFISEALKFFGDPALAAAGAAAWDKGARLALLVAQEPSLLVLDGLEPLQHPPGPLAGQLKDPALQALLTSLARHNPGLCLITSRESVADLVPYRDSSAPELPLPSLPEAAGVQLLHNLGVQGSAAECCRLVREVNGHALTLHLLGHYLKRAHGGDIRRRALVKLDKADAELQGGHAFKAMAAYDAWLAQGGAHGRRQRAVLGLLGLFDRPADAQCLAALRRPPAIAGLTDGLFSRQKRWFGLLKTELPLEEDEWNLAVADLRDCGLLLGENNPGGTAALDAHPLIREFYARRLRQDCPAAWRQGHERLFRHLCDSTPDQPQPTLADLQPLYQAVAHGCRAGLYQEACDQVYFERILRGTGDDGFYSSKKLGAIASDLAAIAGLFEQPWRRPAAALSADDQAWLLNAAAFYLRALGRLAEALQPMGAGVERLVEQKRWKNAAQGAGNMSELQLSLGNITAAREAAERALDYADRSSDAFMRMAVRTTLADALDQAGQAEAAQEWFQRAEAMQAERQPGYPLLYSLAGFRYCDRLLAAAERAAWRVWLANADVARGQGGKPAAAGAAPAGELMAQCQAVAQRAGQALQCAKDNNLSLLSIALDQLTLARAALYAALLGGEAAGLDSAARHGTAALAGLRQAGAQEFIIRGLLSQAWLAAAQGRLDDAKQALAEAEDIARRGPMPLFLADVHLHRARLFSDRDALAQAAALIETHGYGRRAEELADARRAGGSAGLPDATTPRTG
ncbi:MAG: toll/interleukin-1 receptor domain-containing protein [Methylococcaceae bacterium]|nr:MAG: toll/interleukin-1 receptor domain-containing protein [Methylococcaceae bacterium]